jgi:hypothetical protein
MVLGRGAGRNLHPVQFDRTPDFFPKGRDFPISRIPFASNRYRGAIVDPQA